MEKETNQHQIFDNAFLSECAWHKRLLIPLINEVFNKNIPEDAEIEHEANEQFRQVAKGMEKSNNPKDNNSKDNDSKYQTDNETLIKRITDAMIKVEGRKYHFECESKNDGEILIRIVEYDMQIALDDPIYNRYSVKIVLPETAVVFLRNHRNIPETGTITYHKGNQILTHTIPFLKVNSYSLETLIEKHLYMLLPFYLMRYEHAIKHTENKHELIENEALKVYDSIVGAYDNGFLTKIECENILMLCKDVVDEISKNTDIHERLVNTMGNEILLTAEERGIVKGIEQGIVKGREQERFDTTISHIKKLMSAIKVPFDEACRMLDVQDKEKYRNYV